VVEVSAGHAIYTSQPAPVVALIERAARDALAAGKEKAAADALIAAKIDLRMPGFNQEEISGRAHEPSAFPESLGADLGKRFSEGTLGPIEVKKFRCLTP
jgi:hypothetical protein